MNEFLASFFFQMLQRMHIPHTTALSIGKRIHATGVTHHRCICTLPPHDRGLQCMGHVVHLHMYSNNVHAEDYYNTKQMEERTIVDGCFSAVNPQYWIVTSGFSKLNTNQTFVFFYWIVTSGFSKLNTNQTFVFLDGRQQGWRGKDRGREERGKERKDENWKGQ